MVDTTPPALTAPADLVVEQATLAGALVHYALPPATDLVDPHPALSCAPPPGSVFPLGTTQVTCTATDASGNHTQVSFMVTVVDTTPPTLPPLPDLTVEQADLAGTVVSWPTPPAQDACDAAPLIVCQPPAGTAFPLGQTVVTCTATDASGNQSQASFTLEVVDTTAPELDCPEALVLAAPVGGQIELSDPELLAWLGSVGASDVCDAAPLVTHDLSAPIPTGTSRAIAFQAEDASGNQGTCVAYVHVVALGITITSPEDGSCHAGAVTVVVETGGAGVPVTFSGTRTFAGTAYPLSGGPTFSEPGAYAVTAHALGQTASVSFTIDPIPPVVTVTSPSAAPHPGQPYPLSVYRYVPARLNKRCQPEPDPESELPIPLEFEAHDEDGIPGGVVETQVTLDGQPLPVGTTELTEQLFCDLGLGVLGQHTLEVEAFDCAGNRGFKRVTFEVALVEFEGRTLTIKPESLKGNNGVMTAFVELPRSPTGCPADPTVCDVVAESLRLTSLHSGRSAAPTKVQKAGNGKLVLKFRRQDLADEQGKLGTQFQLRGRFFDTTGPSFLLQDEVKKSK